MGITIQKRGKDWLTRKTADTINKLFANQKLAPITLEWKESSVKRNQPETTEYKESDPRIEQQEVGTSGRIRKNQGKWTFIIVNMIVGGCEVKKKDEKRVRIDKTLNVVH